MNSNGDFAGGDLVPYLKDAYLRWTYKGSQRLTLGIHPTLTFDWLDGFWGLRHIEKTPADLYRMDSSRDFGFTFDGPTPIDGLNYAVQFGNESGNGSETQEGKILRFESRYERNPEARPRGLLQLRQAAGKRQPSHGAGRRRFRTRRRAGWGAVSVAGAPVGSGRGRRSDDRHLVGVRSLGVPPEEGELFFRLDDVTGHLGDLETGLPGADGIDYWLLSTQSPFTTWIFGGEWYLHPAVRLSPNLELVRYAQRSGPGEFSGKTPGLHVPVHFLLDVLTAASQ